MNETLGQHSEVSQTQLHLEPCSHKRYGSRDEWKCSETWGQAVAFEEVPDDVERHDGDGASGDDGEVGDIEGGGGHLIGRCWASDVVGISCILERSFETKQVG
jgi:hypothetical protein